MTTLDSTPPSGRTWGRYHRWSGVWFWLNSQVPRGLLIWPTCPIAALSDFDVTSGPAIEIARSRIAAASKAAIAKVLGARLYARWYATANVRLAGVSRSGE